MLSAYMIGFRDTDFLQAAIDSVIDAVDELVFVDGAYSWMAPHLASIGLPADRSGEATEAILARYGERVRYFTGVWDDELHKRSFGFAQCQGDVVLRFDADEHMAIDPAAYERFLRSPASVAPAEFPLMATDDLQWIRGDLAATPQQMMFFKADSFTDPLDHCAYLWLVLSERERARLRPQDPTRIFGQPVARDMHLSTLRSSDGGVARARFYVLRYILDTGRIPWDFLLADSPADAPDVVDRALSAFGPGDFERFLLGTEIVSGIGGDESHRLMTTQLDRAQRAVATEALEVCQRSRAALLDLEAHPRMVVESVPSHFDLTPWAEQGLTHVRFSLSDAPGAVAVTVRHIPMRDEARVSSTRIPASPQGTTVRCDLRPAAIEPGSRVELALQVLDLKPGRCTVTEVAVG